MRHGFKPRLGPFPLRRMQVAKIMTDTVFDADGLPVSVRIGARCRVWSVGVTFTQVIVKWQGSRLELLGVPNGKLRAA